jgi:diguanylate cyclase (GGDEF)-like protein
MYRGSVRRDRLPMETLRPARVPPARSAFDLRWLYLLVLLPLLTELLETGALPHAPREWITEVVLGSILFSLVQHLRRQYAQLAALARIDPLTGLLNRGVFEATVADECARARRFGHPLALVYMDVNRFKEINDTFGHSEGDRVLRKLADAMRKVIREHVDRAFRLGGDEFALLLPGSTARQAQDIVGRIEALSAPPDAPPLACNFGISAGVVELGLAESPDSFVRRADAEMYRHKVHRVVPAAAANAPGSAGAQWKRS